MRNQPARQYQKLIRSEKVRDNQRTATTTISVTGDIAITQHDQLLCRLHDQLGCRSTASENVRSIGIPTVLDRLIQQSIAQVLGPIFETIFSHNEGDEVVLR